MKKQFMSDDDFALLEQSLKEALEFATGKRNDLRVTKLPPRPKPLTKAEIVQIRRLFSASQAVFAGLLNISVKTVRAWESGLREPSDASLKLLTIAREYPQIFLADKTSNPKKPKMLKTRATR
jgi:putative transcriptional regulator